MSGKAKSKPKSTATSAPPTLPTVAVPAKLWKNVPDEHDYPAAVSYLSLCADLTTAERLAKRLREAPIEFHKAKDLLRSSHLVLLPLDDPSVVRDLVKVIKGVKLAPMLVVRGNLRTGTPSVIADGYHRMCASYHLSEDEDIPCQIIDIIED